MKGRGYSGERPPPTANGRVEVARFGGEMQKEGKKEWDFLFPQVKISKNKKQNYLFHIYATGSLIDDLNQMKLLR